MASPNSSMRIRPETAADITAIGRLNQEAFGGDEESRLIECLRTAHIPLISLVAEQDRQVIGHILFSPMSIADEASLLRIAALAPMAVLPPWQNRGIGSQLVQEGLEISRKQGYDAVTVLGHPTYYPRFGFRTGADHGIRCEYAVPDEAFMLTELQPGILAGQHGMIRYHRCFNAL